MAIKCQICGHPQRKLIDAELAKGGTNLRAMSRDYKISYHALWRHKNNHLNAMLVKGYEVKVKEEGRDILSELDGLIRKLNGVLDRAEAKEQDGKLLRAARELRGFYELLSKIQYVLYQQKQEEAEDSLDYMDVEFKENWDRLIEPEEAGVWDAIMVKAMGGHSHRIPRIKYADGNDAPIHDFSEIVGRPVSGFTDDDQETVPEESREEEPTQETEARGQVKDNHLDDLRVRPIPVIIPHDPLKSQQKK